MPDTPMKPESATRPVAIRRLLVLVGLSAFAVLQPVLGKLAEQPEFLVVHDAGPRELATLVAVLALGPPVLLALAEILAGLVAAPLLRGLHALFCLALLSVTALPFLAQAFDAAAPVTLVLAVVTGTIAAAVGRRARAIRENLPWLALAAPAFAALFVLSPGVRPLAFPESGPVIGGGAASPTPIVLLVFDALPAGALLDEHGRIDAGRYPNLRALADRAHWFPNALTESDSTTYAVPALLTGRRPDPDKRPTLADHPESLFTLLRDSHELIAFESTTRLAPEGAPKPDRGSRRERLSLLLSDSVVLYLHLLLPGGWRDRLPSIETRWSGFSAEASDEPSELERIDPPDREQHYEAFLDAMVQTGRPPIFFLHTILPHTPYQYYPSGRRYTTRRIDPSGQGHQWGRWSDDPLVVEQSQQRFLLQVGHVDGLVGRVMARLEELGLFADALIVVTSDHGNSFRVGESRRGISRTNAGDIVNVPLIVKRPHQDRGVVDERAVSIVDVMPTIADVADLERPVDFEGQSVFADDYRAAEQIEVRSDERATSFAVPEILADRDASLARRLALFGTGDMGGLYGFGEYGALVGRSPLELEQGTGSTIEVKLASADRFEDVDPTESMIPGNLYGIVQALEPDAGEPTFAVALNGRIVAVTRAYRDESGSELRNWGVLAPEHAFRAGENTVGVWQVRGPEDAPVLVPLDRASASDSYLGVNVGGRPVTGVSESGFWPHGRWGSRVVRWTRGEASLAIPIGDERPVAVQVGLRNAGPKGAQLRLEANGRVIFEGPVRGEWEQIIPLDGVPMETGVIELEIESSTFVPSELVPGSKDSRRLGVAVEAVVLL
jgi:hypothetical protein